MWRLSSCSLTGLSRHLDRSAGCTHQFGISSSTRCCAVGTYSAVWEGGAGLGRRHEAVVGGGGRSNDIVEEKKTQAKDGGGVSGEKEHGESPFAVGRDHKDGVGRATRRGTCQNVTQYVYLVGWLLLSTFILLQTPDFMTMAPTQLPVTRKRES